MFNVCFLLYDKKVNWFYKHSKYIPCSVSYYCYSFVFHERKQSTSRQKCQFKVNYCDGKITSKPHFHGSHICFGPMDRKMMNKQRWLRLHCQSNSHLSRSSVCKRNTEGQKHLNLNGEYIANTGHCT